MTAISLGPKLFLRTLVKKQFKNRKLEPKAEISQLAQLVVHRTAVREVTGSNLDRTNTQGLKITEEKALTS